MRKTNTFSAARRLRANNQRRTLLKKVHQRVLQRRKQFAAACLNEESSGDFQQAC
ncbi:hypothetical protein ISG33_02600 [Glaciecola sp. MH2013]|uniref:hypothetical protein n=1 Tax=Glaciecola sp. MH2013 TaxID=2785524 RepID=UPI00189D56B3|nr:hypothetical protein [Glaciecola sp. MH2013]MBF7072292.1 hypothetical protein [Glaciecola sp. MH2013]